MAMPPIGTLAIEVVVVVGVRLARMAPVVMGAMESALQALMVVVVVEPTAARPGVAQLPATIASERVRERYIAVTARMAAAVPAAAAAIITPSAKALIAGARDHKM